MPRTRSLAWSQLKIGALALAALVLAAVFIYLVGGQGGFFWQQYHLKTRFADVQGLQTGAAVRVAGVTVGAVDDIQFVGPQVEVTVRVSEDMQSRITTDSRASIGSLSLLGAPVVDISPSRTGRPLQDWEYVLSRRPYGQLADVADSATKGLEQATALLQDLRRGRGTVGKLFTDDTLYKEMASFVDAAERVMDLLRSGNGTLGELLRNPSVHRQLEAALTDLSAITRRLNRGEGSLGRLLADDAFARSLSSATESLNQVTAKIDRGDGTIGRMVNDATLFNRLNSVSARLDTVLTSLNEGEGSAGQLLRDKQLYENMNGAVRELRDLLAEIRKDPKKYLNVKVSIF
jgi:phospholipid/cholesterol/gamma-HCH transport system substrate-binding protein